MKNKLEKFRYPKRQLRDVFFYSLFGLFYLSSLGQSLPAVESFEDQSSLKYYLSSVNGNLSFSKNHHRFGEASLKWEWTGINSSIETTHFRLLSKKESPLAYGDHFPSSPTFMVSIYNESPQQGSLRFLFGVDGKEEVWFDLKLDFYGWRRVWVPFYEMDGNAPKKESPVNYDHFEMRASSTNGTVFLDDIIFSQFQDDRHQYPDFQVPFIKKGGHQSDDHWMPLISDFERLINLKPLPTSVAVKLDLLRIEKGIDQNLTIDKKYKVYINTLREMYESLHLKDNGKTILGSPLTYRIKQEFFNKGQQGPFDYNEIQDFGKVMKKLANFYDRANPDEQQEIKEMFVNGSRYFLDQGWQAGASGGTRHHIGYNVREITEAFFQMRKVLREVGLLDDIGASLQWLYNSGMVLRDEKDFHVNIDYLNTQSYYHLMLIFLSNDPGKQAAMLSAYSKYMSITLAQQNEEWGFKIDGTSWHHNGHYPAYAMGAFRTVPKVFRALAGTRFRIHNAGHQNFKKAFLATRIYSQLYDWGFGNAGRHPLEDNSIESLKNQYIDMAYSGNPQGTSSIDADVASAYLRLWGDKDLLNSSVFTNVNGIKKESLKGYYSFPYAATAIHRRHDWAAIIKGYSKYVWSSEIYVDENRYGRYPANGTIELLNSEGEKGSGIRQEGWDWNRYPGATIIYLPFEELEPDMPLVMFRSNETFAGAVELDGNGVFGMVLNEDKGSNADGPVTKIGYPGKLKANKSVFSFGDKLICIGTNISSVDKKNPTQTNLFQTFLNDKKTVIPTSSGEIKKFSYETQLTQGGKGGSWLVDPYGNGYHILSKSNIYVKKEEQHSFDNRYSVHTGQSNPKLKGGNTETTGDYASAWIDHGFAPTKGSYQYVIYPFLEKDVIQEFGNYVKKDDSFAILRADSIAHIVLDRKTNTTGYSVFEANKLLENGFLKSVSQPSLVMIRQNNANILTISAVQPDLNFPLDANGKFKNYSKSVKLTLSIRGKWQMINKSDAISIDNSTNTTLIVLECKDGFSEEFKLQKI